MKFLKRLGALVALVVCSAFILTACSNEYGKYRYNDFVNSRVRYARKAARQARFEYGQTPKVRRDR